MAGMAQTPTPATAGMSPAEVLIVAALVAVIGAGLLTWLGAALAAVLVGAPPPGGVADAVGAIPGLVSTPGDPIGAWSAAVGRPVQAAAGRGLLGGDRDGRRDPAGVGGGGAGGVAGAVPDPASARCRRPRPLRHPPRAATAVGQGAGAGPVRAGHVGPVAGGHREPAVGTEPQTRVAPLVGVCHRRDPPRPAR